MHWGNGWNFGMHVIGWLTWAVLIAAGVWALIQAAGGGGSAAAATPQELLQRLFAQGGRAEQVVRPANDA